MQTFLPFRSYTASAECLDYRRLGKQRVETKQILLALTDPTYGWQHHPAVRMWRGHETALALYGVTICREWRKRGFKDTLLPWFEDRMTNLTPANSEPSWLTEEFCRSHQSNLLRKDPTHYAQHFFGVPDTLPYIWPV